MKENDTPASRFLAAPRTREELDRDYMPTRFVESMAAVAESWGARTREARAMAGTGYRDGLPYGEHPRETFDFYGCGEAHAPLLVFIHGGFWKAVSRHESGFVAPRWLRRGVHVAVLDYALAPEVSLSEIVAQCRRGLAHIGALSDDLGFDSGRVVIAGHSAGGHLAAITQCLPDAIDVAGLALLSGVFDLGPVQGSYVNDTVGISDMEVRGLSPARLTPRRALPLVVAVGENEPTAFHEQSRALASHWGEAGCTTDFHLVSRRNHFDLLDDFAEPESGLGRAIAALLEPQPGR